MRGSRFTQEQIVGILKEHEVGAATAALAVEVPGPLTDELGHIARGVMLSKVVKP